MANSAKRKQGFILGLFVVMALAVAFLAFRPIPAPVAEQTIELDTAHVLK